jgi:hypothetical protein
MDQIQFKQRETIQDALQGEKIVIFQILDICVDGVCKLNKVKLNQGVIALVHITPNTFEIGK